MPRSTTVTKQPIITDFDFALDFGQYTKAVSAAKSSVIAKLGDTPPDRNNYQVRDSTGHSVGLSRWMWGLLFLMALLCLTFSVGKEIVAADAILSPVQNSSELLSVTWRYAAIVSMVFASEIGAFFFSLFAGLFPGDGNKYDFHLRMWMFRVTAMACAGVALWANVTVTGDHAEQLGSMGSLSWYLAWIIPIIVLIIGLAAESMLVSVAKRRAEAVNRYWSALDQYNAIKANPANTDVNPTWTRTLQSFVWKQLAEAYKFDDERTRYLSTLDVGVRVSIIERIIRNNSFESDEVQPEDAPRPTPAQLPAQTPSRLGFAANIPSSVPNSTSSGEPTNS